VTRQSKSLLMAGEPRDVFASSSKGIPLLECLLQDMRYARRQLRSAPWFTLLGVVTLAF
jgi:hypothetical protein